MDSREEKFVFKYNGDLEYIDFDTLYTSQLHFTEFIKELKQSLSPDGDLQIKVKALPKGSFPIELYLDFELAKDVLAWGGGALLAAGGFISAINSIFDLFKNLKGNKPDKEEVKGDNTIIYIDNRTFEIPTSIYNIVKNNPKIRQEISLSFEKIEDDIDITGVELLDEEKRSLIEIAKEEFVFFDRRATEKILYEEIPADITVPKNNQILSIFKVVFSKGFKWQFIYKGIKISANIEDNDFLLNVTKGNLSFSNGDAMNCDIQIKQTFNEIANTFENSSYTIKKVNEIIPRPKQTRMFDNDK